MVRTAGFLLVVNNFIVFRMRDAVVITNEQMEKVSLSKFYYYSKQAYSSSNFYR